jgi:putative membrane protein
MHLQASLKTVLISALLAAGAFAAEPKDDHKFVEEAASGGMVEVKLGQFVVERGSDSGVKAFAQQMVTDHSKANEELKGLVDGRSGKLPTELAKEHQKMWDDLSKLSAEKLDQAYIDAMVEDHKQDVKLFEKEAKSGKDPALKAYASRTVPTLKHHLGMAQGLQKNRRTSSN